MVSVSLNYIFLNTCIVVFVFLKVTWTFKLFVSMSYDIDNEVTESKWEKPVKRVRFSDEVKDVQEYDRKDNREIFLNESEITGSTSSLIPVSVEQDAILFKELCEINNKVPNFDTSIDNTEKNLPDSDINSMFPHNIEVSNKINSASAITHADVNESGTAEYLRSATSSPESERCDINDLINETGLMSISEPDADDKERDFAFPEMHSLFISSLETESQKSIFQTTVQSANKDSVSSLPRKRSLEGTLIKKQTSKLSSCLSKNTTSVTSADELKNAVFKAWNEVKSEKTPFQPTLCTTDVKKTIDTPKGASSSIFHLHYMKSKRKVKSASYKISKPVPHKTKEDLEESKMAFEAWKKKKDELLKQQFSEKCKKEKKERLDLLINEKMRKNDAESAYSAWNAHKMVVMKMDKRKKQWLIEKEREKLNAKMEKNEKSTKVYYEWLKKRGYFKSNSICKSNEDRPCWTPPGKANSIM